MKRVASALIIGLVFAASSWAAGASVSAPADPRTMTFPTEPFAPPKAERVTFPNGMIVYLLEDHELPLVSLSALIRTGSIYDPPDKVGLAELTGTVIRTGGTATRSGDDLDEALEFVGAEMGSWVGLDSGGASLNVLTKDMTTGVEWFAEMLMRPAFAQEKIDLARNQTIEAIRRRNDHPGSIASREFRKLLYGPNHPYGRESTEATIRAITREDLVAFHRRYYHPNTTMLAVTGDFQRSDMLALLRRAFDGWSRESVTWPPVPPVTEPRNEPVNLIRRDVTQTQVRMGWLGIKQSDPDFFALSLLDDILGGQAFTSRLFQEVRTKAGLAYSVGSVLNAGRFDRGTFFLYAQTKAESTTRAIRAMRAEIDRILTAPVSEHELAEAKQAFMNSFVFSFANPAQITNRQMSLEYYGLPADFLERYRANVERVSARDLLRVAKRHLAPNRLVVFAVGDDRRFEQPLATFGRVRTLELADPSGPPPAPRAGSAGSQ